MATIRLSDAAPPGFFDGAVKDPTPYNEDLDDFCDHEDYEADILTGLATCTCCNHRWFQTADEIQREREAQEAWDRQCEEWERNPPPPLPPAPPTEDDIPF